MVLREKTPLPGSLCIVIFVFGIAACSDVIGLSTNDTSANSSSLSATKNVEDGLSLNSEYCSEWSGFLVCHNGGECVENVCKCLPGTKGDQCEIIEGCEHSWEVSSMCGYYSDVSCKFNRTSGKPYCQCLDHFQLFDSYDKKCKGCSCGRNGNCHFVNGKKKCDCEEGYAERPSPYWSSVESQCESCDCGLYSSGCSFVTYYQKECSCKSGYSKRDNRCYECDCGPNGDCTFNRQGGEVCSCQDGYSVKDGYCVECDCGPDGECVWDEFGQQSCNCPQGYGIKYGECTKCTCYMNGVSDVNCTFSFGYQECICPPGYEERMYGFCTEMDGCTDRSVCPRNSECINSEGSYKCVCNDGYKPIGEEFETKRFGCQDIDECYEQDECPYRDTTKCINTPGSYYCECRAGYYSKSSRYSIENEGCQEDQTGWKVGYSILLIVFGFIALILIIAILKKGS